MKAKRDKVDNEKCFRHTTSRTGKWRGERVSDYKKYHSPSHPVRHDDTFLVVLKGFSKDQQQIVSREKYKQLVNDHAIKETLRGIL